MNAGDKGQILLKLNMNKQEIRHKKRRESGRILKYTMKKQDDSCRGKKSKGELGYLERAEGC